MEKYGKCPICDEELDFYTSDVDVYESDSFETNVRKLFYEHLRQVNECLVDIVANPGKKHGRCPICSYELNPRNSSANIIDEDPEDFKYRMMLNEHFEASPKCLLKIVSVNK